MTNVVISFLGAGKYNPNCYSFGGCRVDARYACTAYLAYIRSSLHTQIDALIICGTQSSTWNLLPEYFTEKAEDMFGSAAASQIAASLKSPEVSNAGLAIKEFQDQQRLGEEKKENSDHATFTALLSDLSNSLNTALEPASMKVILLEHSELMADYSQQVELLEKIRRLPFINGDTAVYLDITNGMRIMPFAVFANFQCLCQLNSINIHQICYMPELMPKTEPLPRLNAIEQTKARLRSLKATSPASFKEKISRIQQILKTERPSAAANRPPVEVCFLDGAIDVLETASMISQFKTTCDPACFCGAVTTSDSSYTAFLTGRLREISYLLNIGRYVRAAALIRKHGEDILAGISDPQAGKLLKDFFAWAYRVNKKDGSQTASALKELCWHYLTAKNYVQAVNSCYTAMLNYEFDDTLPKLPNNATIGEKHKRSDQIKNIIKKNYTFEKKKNKYPFTNLSKLRGMLIHKNDLSDENDREKLGNTEFLMKKVIHNFGPNNNSVNVKKLPIYIRESLLDLGVCSPHENAPGTPAADSQKTPRENILISFFGSGDYSRCDYTYSSPSGAGKLDFELPGSRVMGISLAKKFSTFQPKSRFTKLLICGTRTSNWRLLLQSLQQEYGSRLSESAREELEVLIRNVTDNQDTDTADASVSADLVAWLNTFLSQNQKDLGLTIQAVMTGDRIAGSSFEKEIFDQITENVPSGSRLSFDITHCYRIIPIVVLCAVEYLTVAKNVRLEHLFYGEIPLERDFNFLNGLKKSQMPDDNLFAEKLSQIEDILKEDQNELNVSGSVYEMENITRQFDYSFALGQYRATDNPAFLDRMIAFEYTGSGTEDDEPEIYEDFRTGVFLNNFFIVRESSGYLMNVADSLMQRKMKDPVHQSLRKDLIDCLMFRVPSEQSPDGSFDWRSQTAFLCDLVQRSLDQENYMEALCLCYEAMLCLPSCISRELIKLGRDGFEFLDHGTRVRFTNRLPKDLLRCLRSKESQNENPKLAQLLKESNLFSGKKSTDEKDKQKDVNQCNYCLASIFFGKEWIEVSRKRDTIFHADDSRDPDSREAIVSCLTRALDAADKLLAQSGWQQDTGSAG